MTKQHHYEVAVRWTGDLGKGTADYRAYSRDHELSAPGKAPIGGSSDPAFRGDAARYNPEDLLVGALSAIDCEAEDIIERHSHALVVGRVLDIQTSQRTAALAYWQGRYVAIDQDEDAARLAEVSLPTAGVLRGT